MEIGGENIEFEYDAFIMCPLILPIRAKGCPASLGLRSIEQFYESTNFVIR